MWLHVKSHVKLQPATSHYDDTLLIDVRQQIHSQLNYKLSVWPFSPSKWTPKKLLEMSWTLKDSEVKGTSDASLILIKLKGLMKLFKRAPPPPPVDWRAVDVFYTCCLENLLKFDWGINPETSPALPARACVRRSMSEGTKQLHKHSKNIDSKSFIFMS